MGELGNIPGFLATHELGRASPGVVGLARLEWARVDVFDDADAAPLQLQDLVAAGTSAPEELGLTLVPSARLLRVDAAVLPLWKRLDGGADPVADGEPEDATPKLGVCVWRRGFSVFHRSLPDDEERCLHALREPGTTLAQLGALLLEHQQPDAPAQQSAKRLAVLLDLWARNELLTRSE